MLHQSFHFQKLNQAFEIEHLDHPLFKSVAVSSETAVSTFTLPSSESSKIIMVRFFCNRNDYFPHCHFVLLCFIWHSL